MIVEFNALVKHAGKKALVSGDSSYEVMLRGEDNNMAKLVLAPSDSHCKITVEWVTKNASEQ